MNLFRLFSLLSFILLSSPNLYAQKRPLDIDAIESWKRITETVISPDGHWIAYKIEPWRGDSRVCLYNCDGQKRFERECGKDLRITDDSQYMVFTIEPAYEQVRELKRKKTPDSDLPGNALGIYDINSEKFESIENIKNYKIPEQWGGWLAYQLDTLQKDSTALNLRNLQSGQDRSWPFVTEYHFATKAKRLFFVSMGDEAGLYLYDFSTEPLHPIMTGENDYRQITIAEDGDTLAFLAKPAGDRGSEDYSLYLWTGKGQAKQIVSHRSQGIPQDWRISEHGRISFSDNSQRIFFGIAPIRPKRDPNILDDEYPGVDVWHGSEGLLHTVQLVNRDRELNRTYRTLYSVDDGRLIQIETEDIPESTLLDNGNADHVLLHSSRPYELESMWDPMHYDVYLLDLNTGDKRAILKDTRSGVEPSPGGAYLMWFDYSEYSYYTYHIASRTKHRITEPSVLRADTETNTTFDYNAPYGSPAWLQGDRAVLIYDRYDIWKVDPRNKRKPENLTVNGRDEKTVYRLIRFSDSESGLHEGETQYVTGVNEVTRSSGYYKFGLKKASAPKRLIDGRYRLSTPIKAKNSETVVYTKETFGTFPDLLVSDLTFRDNTRISDANPQQTEFLWGSAELYQWTSLDGRKLDGILYKPEDFDPSRKYPMIVQFFHKSSDQLFHYRTPQFHRSRIDYHYFVSNGYIVFNPDIYFDEGYIGESAYKSIMPGVTALVDDGFVDPKRIGAQGHSYSGYQVAYLVTRTNMFACVEAGAPVVNFFSAYGGIRWQSGRNRAAQYEHDQTLGTIWEVPLRFFENSPLFAMDKVTTPVLIMHNDNDGAVPWYQGIEYFIALRRMQKPVWLLNYNGEGHSLRELKNQKDFQVRLSQFFGHYLKDAPMPQWMDTGIPAIEKDHNLGYELGDTY